MKVIYCLFWVNSSGISIFCQKIAFILYNNLLLNFDRKNAYAAAENLEGNGGSIRVLSMFHNCCRCLRAYLYYWDVWTGTNEMSIQYSYRESDQRCSLHALHQFLH